MTKNNNNNQPIDKTEIVWPGKRKEVERVSLPFQVIETINAPRGARQKEMFNNNTPADWKNRLIWGDNLLVMGSLLKEFAGKINLIYIDPPFATGDDFSFTVQIGDGAEITKEPSALEVKAYRDTWGKGMQSYLQMMYDRLVLMKELLADDGSIYVHLDYRVSHYIKMILDEIFGEKSLRNEIIWFYPRGGDADKQFNRKHDSIFWYSKSDNSWIFNWKDTLIPYTEEQLARFKKKDEKGKFYWNVNPRGERVKTYLRKAGIGEYDVWNIGINATELKEIGYPTAKPPKLLERIIKASSNEGDIVADFFSGSGTTVSVAEKLNRKWIGVDLSRFAIQTTRKRLLDMSAKPFKVQNLGKYERHHWAKLNGKYKDYVEFILELYHAERIDGFTYLHGKKAKSFVRVGSVDAPVTLSEIRSALEECQKNKIKKLDILGWEWEMGLHDLIKEEAEKYGVKLGTFQIPREVMELSVADAQKRDVQFFELAYLEVEAKVKDKKATITLKDFIIPNPELLPEQVKGKVKNWSDFIDYWAVDWMFNQHKKWTEEDDTFHNMNQRYRTRKEPKLELSMNYDKYKKSGKYNILVKVVDIFGNDTTKLITIKI